MHKYLVERTVPGAGQVYDRGLAAIAGESNQVLRNLGPDIIDPTTAELVR